MSQQFRLFKKLTFYGQSVISGPHAPILVPRHSLFPDPLHISLAEWTTSAKRPSKFMPTLPPARRSATEIVPVLKASSREAQNSAWRLVYSVGSPRGLKEGRTRVLHKPEGDV
jgi:hypothetical protein